MEMPSDVYKMQKKLLAARAPSRTGWESLQRFPDPVAGGEPHPNPHSRPFRPRGSGFGPLGLACPTPDFQTPQAKF